MVYQCRVSISCIDIVITRIPLSFQHRHSLLVSEWKFQIGTTCSVPKCYCGSLGSSIDIGSFCFVVFFLAALGFRNLPALL